MKCGEFGGRDVEIAMNEVEEVKDDQCRICGEDEGMINEEDFNWQTTMRPARDPSQPTAKEREDHEALHMPYRAWCAHCVRGRGISSHHVIRKEGPEERDQRVPVIGMDYGFLGRNNEKTHPIRIARDSRTGATYATWVPVKGASVQWVVKKLCSFVDGLGYPEVIIRSD